MSTDNDELMVDGPLVKCRHWELCSYLDLHLLRQEFLNQYALEPIPVAPGIIEWWNSLIMMSGTNQLQKMHYQKRFLVVQTSHHVSSGQAFVAAQHRTRTWNRCWLTGNVRQSPTVIRFHFLKFTWIIHRIHLLFLSVYVDEIKLAGKKQNINRMWENTHERRLFGRTDIISWPCLYGLYSKRMAKKQRYCRWLPKYVRNPGFLPVLWKNNQFFHSIGCEFFFMVLWTWESDAKKCVGRYCELGEQNNSTATQKSQTPCFDDLLFKEEEMGSVGELSTVCTQVVLKCLHLARIGRPDFLVVRKNNLPVQL